MMMLEKFLTSALVAGTIGISAPAYAQLNNPSLRLYFGDATDKGPCPPYLCPNQSSEPQPIFEPRQNIPSPAHSSNNTENDVGGYILTGFGIAGLVYGILVKQTCNELTGKERECTDRIKTEQRNARLLVIGGSIAVGGLGLYFLLD